MRDVVVTSAVRTAIGRFGGSLRDVGAIELGAVAVKEAVRRTGLAPDSVDRVVIGENLQMNRGGNPARRVHLAAGFPIGIDDYTVNMNCASGLRAIACAAQDTMLGEIDMAVAGGMENMSQAPYILEGARFGYRLGNGVLVDFLADCILGDAGPMAEAVAETYGISREEQDRFAHESQMKAVKAQDEGLFDDEIVAVEIPGKAGAIPFRTDEHPRRDSSLERLAKLKPGFRQNGTVTAGNSSGINDGAAALTLMSSHRAGELGITPLGVLRGWASAGVEPGLFGMGPVPAVNKLLRRTGLTIQDIGLVELNEAFASSTIACIRELEVDPTKVNVNGGAIALGHPVGATGVILCVKLLGEMRRRGIRYGMVAMCIGSGQGMCLLLESPS